MPIFLQSTMFFSELVRVPVEFIDALGIPVERILGICFLIVLGIGAAACIFGISSVGNMPGRKITGWLAIGSIILILIFPYCERNPEWLDRLVGDSFILILIFKLGTHPFFRPVQIR